MSFFINYATATNTVIVGASIEVPVDIQSSEIAYDSTQDAWRVNVLNSAGASPLYVLDSTIPLSANSVFVGSSVNVINESVSYIDAEANSDAPGVMYIDFSEDDFNTVAFSAAIQTSSSTVPTASNPFISGTYPYNAQSHVAVVSGYVRVRYVNGTVNQTHFQLSHRFAQA